MQFTLNEIQQRIVDTLVEKYKDNTQKGRSDKAYTNGISDTECKILESVFAELLPKQTLSHAMVLVEWAPWVIHTDYLNNNDKNPASAVLIPYTDENTHTLIFNEECTVEGRRIVEETFPDIHNGVTRAEYEQYLDHCRWETVQKVSMDEIYKWNRGTGVVWDRRRLHSSDNFQKNGVNKKIALTMFTEHVAD
tara:strand:- start:2350 stop:2928 length:579 start_codon:yes stop_codon:yes gene_type:complete